MTANLPYGPPVNTDIGYYRFFLLTFFCVSDAMLVVRYLLGEEKPMLAAPIKVAIGTIFNAFGMVGSRFEPMTSRS